MKLDFGTGYIAGLLTFAILLTVAPGCFRHPNKYWKERMIANNAIHYDSLGVARWNKTGREVK